jgi:hypothetical protein
MKSRLRTLAGAPVNCCGCMAGPGFLCARADDGNALDAVRNETQQRLVAAKGAGCGYGLTSYFRICGQENPHEVPLGDAQMRAGAGLAFVAVGAIMIFALRADSPQWINLQITGVVLVLAGALGIALPARVNIPLLSRRYQARTGRRSTGLRD